MATAADPTRRALLRQERSRTTREALAKAAEHLWRTKGFDETTVADICAAAGVAKGTFYFHFATKEDLLVELSFETVEAATDELQQLIDDDQATTDDLLKATLTGFASRVSRNPKPIARQTVIELYRRIDAMPELTEGRAKAGTTFGAILERGQARGEIRTDRPVQETAWYLHTLMLNGILAWSYGHYPKMDLADQLWRHAQALLDGARP